MAHKTQEELAVEINKGKKKVRIGGKYLHYKHLDRLYVVLQIGFIEETEKVCVVYQACYGKKLIWVRPLSDFLAKVKLENGKKVDRYAKVE